MTSNRSFASTGLMRRCGVATMVLAPLFSSVHAAAAESGAALLLHALYGIKPDTTVTRSYKFYNPRGELKEVKQVTLRATLRDGCHVDVSKTFITINLSDPSANSTTTIVYGYDAAKAKALRNVIEIDPEEGAYAQLTGYNVGHPPSRVITTHLSGNGAECVIWPDRSVSNCNANETSVGVIRDARLNPRVLQQDFQRAKVACP